MLIDAKIRKKHRDGCSNLFLSFGSLLSFSSVVFWWHLFSFFSAGALNVISRVRRAPSVVSPRFSCQDSQIQSNPTPVFYPLPMSMQKPRRVSPSRLLGVRPSIQTAPLSFLFTPSAATFKGGGDPFIFLPLDEKNK